MKNIRKLIFFLLIIMVSISITYTDKTTVVHGNPQGPGAREKTVTRWRDENKLNFAPAGLKKDVGKFDTPEYFFFNPSVTSEESKVYGENDRFYENAFLGKYHVYIMKSPSDKNKYLDNSATYLYEELLANTQGEYGKTGWKLVTSSNPNLKLGKSQPNDNSTKSYSGDNTGNMIIQSGPYKGKKYEWRYIGYAYNGARISNPYFPADYPTDTKNWELKYLEGWWNPPHSFDPQSPYVEGGSGATESQRKEWFEQYLFKQYPEFKKRAQKEGFTGREWKYWDTRLVWYVDPLRGSGMVKGWHDDNGHLKYRTTALEMSTPKRNVRLTELAVYDSDGDLVAKTSRSGSVSIANPSVVNNYVVKNLVRGETYTIKAKLKNMDTAYATLTNPTTLDYLVAINEQVGKRNAVFKDEDLITSWSHPGTIPKGGTAQFTWEYKIPMDLESKIQIMGHVPDAFYKNYDNYNQDDDTLSLVFDKTPEDMEMLDQVELIDASGRVVNEVVANQAYSIRFNVSKPLGSKTVGKAGNANNPYTTINVRVDDGRGTNTYQLIATKTLKPNEFVTISTGNWIVPRTPYIKVIASIDEVHNAKGYNDITTNDTVMKEWYGVLDFSVKDLKVSTEPKLGRQDLTFRYKANLLTTDGLSKQVKVVLYQGSTKVKEESVLVPTGQAIEGAITANVNLSAGDTQFRVEINPAPREYTEFNPSVVNVYENNIASTSIHVKAKENPIAECEIVYTYNSWTQQYYVQQWDGHYERYYYQYPIYQWDYVVIDGTYYWYQTIVDWIDTWYDYCVTDWYDSWYETKSHYESFNITHVYFQSKVTKDTQGGWVNILSQPGKIKAGYGFELKVVTNYRTNRYSAMPQGWSYGCDGKSVSPSYSTVYSPSLVTLTMPYNDQWGDPVYYNLSGSSSGSWDNRTVEYTLPYRNAFGLKVVPQIFVNEGARNGLYPIRIDTPPFYGSYDKPSTSNLLCDRKTVYIQVIGGGSDDLNTHIVQ